MLKGRGWVLLLAVAICCGALEWLALAVYPPGVSREVRVELNRPFEPTSGFEFKARPAPGTLGSGIGSDSNGRGLSPLTLWENGIPLSPAHAFHSQVQRTGKGAFVHWGDEVYFSSSDNTDPRANGRTYEIRRTTGLPLFLYLAILIAGYVLVLGLLMVALRSLGDRKWASVIVYASTVVVTFAIVEGAAWVLVENQLTNYGPLVRNLYRQAFSSDSSPAAMPHEPGLMVNFTPHHYLNYALNPNIAYCGIKQFNARYLVRRGEPLGQEKGNRWRILVLGGSTTFAEGIPKEQDTWPYVLESMIRNQCDPLCEVINGGVGGYTLLENFVHYVVLLRDLSPDVVLFYTGINDVHPRMFGEIRTDYSNYRVPWRTSGEEMWIPNKWLGSLFVYRYYFLNKVVLETIFQGIGGQVSKKGPSPAQWPEALKRNSAMTYRNHLEDFVRLLQGQHIRVAIIPQYFAPLNDRDKVFGSGVDENNRVNEEVAKAQGLPFATEILEPGLFDPQDVFDNCHFTEDGNRKMGSTVFGFLKKNGLLPPCNAH